jgi:hypothetical protein
VDPAARSKIQRGFAAIQKNAFNNEQRQYLREEFAQADSSTSRSPGRRVPLTNYYGRFYGRIAVGYPFKNFTGRFYAFHHDELTD